MIKIAICDDNIIFTSEIEQRVIDLAQKYFLSVTVDVFWDGYELIKSLKQENNYDLIYLDIEMKQCNGIEVAEYMRKNDLDAILIYVSNYESYLKELFEVEPFRFIKKPIKRMIFEKYFIQAIQRIQDMKLFYEYKVNRVVCKVPMKDILYFESKGRMINIVTKSNIKTFYGKLNDVEVQVEGNKCSFIRVHQSYLVNFLAIEQISYDGVTLFNGQYIAISKDRQKRVKIEYMNILGGSETLEEY